MLEKLAHTHLKALVAICVYKSNRCKRRAYWKICHPKNIAYAQEWVAPYGTNGAYMRDEVYKDEDGIIWKCKEDYCITDQKEHPSAWVKI